MAISKETRIIAMVVIDTAFFFTELGVGLWVGSLALMADAFHMLNDIISLLIGLWAVKAARKSSTVKYSYGWLRAEILGAFFNAVFLIALCMSIMLESIVRFIDPPVISNPKLILIVGCCGLASNLVGFLVLGGHGHSHGPGDGSAHGHSHSHGNEIRDAEEGHSHSHAHGEHEHNHEHDHDHDHNRLVHDGESYADAVKGNKHSSKGHIHFPPSDHDHGSDSVPSSPTKARKHKRRTSRGGLSNVEDMSFYPSSFRQAIIEASQPPPESSSEDGEEDGDIAETRLPIAPTPKTPLLAEHNANKHNNHNHRKPKKAKNGHSHGHNHDDMGMNAMILHVIGDALGNVGVIVSALIIWLTNWPGRYYADPAVSLFITIIILRSAIPLTKATAKILLQATPDSIDQDAIIEDIETLDGVVSCHHPHIWQLSESQIVASMHVQIAFPLDEAGGTRYMALAKEIKKCLHEYNIHSATIQPEFCTKDGHDHLNTSRGMGLDGNSTPHSRVDEDCLLNCIENCNSKGCCSTSAPSSVTHTDDHDHDHTGHNHSH
ncbi:hypothetical protein HYALB_00007612 [Hymenoscyphus albidus]|uniref:Cation efflux protein n=1 Tax=Hymenoscyphus albidus TaxID=595503 RepID=A0A9N9LKU6_9HELO|nr:hypothetical protein HYALB_00007612 [Hymenoscyphus albidus]